MFKWLGKSFRNLILLVVFFFGLIGFFKFKDFLIFRQIIHNLKAESRIAEVLVTESSLDEYTRKYTTTIKFLEYDVKGKPLKARYFTFKGNLIQFQTLVVRFDDKYIEEGHRMKGKSIFLFLKAFVLDGKNTQEFLITSTEEIPEGYKVGRPPTTFEKEIWGRFWKYALDPGARARVGIKNAQIEAPGSVFVPGTIYTLIIEHDGGIRIDTRPIPEILKDENIR
ncbi:MAG: hypothetical protein HYZ87_03815 [Candidatus Omnitrophica bacterium]|nr:hypothetical protein [Candidatus Omnitrophota bacterium]